VVGSGAAGGWAAKELTEGGMNVLLLEAGRAINEATDFPPNPKPPPKNIVRSRILFALRGQHIQARMGGNFYRGVNRFYVNDRENPYTYPPDAPFYWYRGRQVGGRMHTWARAAFRMSDYEFHRPDVDPSRGADWPIRYADIAKYYDKVEDTLGVTGNCDHIVNLPDGHFVERFPVPANNRIFAEWVTQRTGIKIIRSRIVVHSTNRQTIPLTLAQKTGRMVLQPDSVVARILIDGTTGKAKGVGYYDRRTKQYKEASAGKVFLCASAYESVRILLNSACSQYPNGIGASSGVLGRYVTDHVMLGTGGTVSQDFLDAVKTAGEKYVPPSTDPYDFGAYSMYMPNFCGGLKDKNFVGGYGAQCGVRGTSQNWWMLLFGQMEPRYENFVALDRRKKDEWGIPVAHVEMRHRENEFNMAKHMQGTAKRIADACGFTIREGGGTVSSGLETLLFRSLSSRVFQEGGAFYPGSAIHEVGGARMGSDPKTSVVSPYCQCWDVPNVYVTDASCFPSLGFANHALTIMAVTARACDYILKH
jgi:choline dehydrogenase-like flavoprotein